MSQLGIGRPGPRYVERGGDVVFRHPCRAKDVRMWNFVLRADARRIDALLERCFTEPSNGAERYEAIGNFVLLNVVDVKSLGARSADQALGTMAEKEVAIWVPARDLVRGRLVWMVPYMFVDGGAPLAEGRETYGFPKQLGTVEIEPPDAVEPSLLRLSAIAFERFGPTSKATRKVVVDISGTGSAVATSPRTEEELRDACCRLAGGASDPAEVRSLLGREAPGPLLPPEPSALRRELAAGAGRRVDMALVLFLLMTDILDGDLTMAFLKQFRAVENAEIAAYQAIVDVDLVMTGMRRWGLLADHYEIRISDLESEPICRELGIPAVSARPSVGFWMDFDFDVELGRVLWQASPS